MTEYELPKTHKQDSYILHAALQAVLEERSVEVRRVRRHREVRREEEGKRNRVNRRESVRLGGQQGEDTSETNVVGKRKGGLLEAEEEGRPGLVESDKQVSG